jgi:general stress protein 26
MSHAHLDDIELEKRLWSEIDKARFGMLGLMGGRLQPMTAFCDKERGAIWFFTRRTTDLARMTGAGHDAQFCIVARDQEFQASIGGVLTPDHDRAKIWAFWNPIVSAWFPDGRDDPELTLLKLSPIDAQVWVMRGGPLRFGFEILRANVTHTEPPLRDENRPADHSGPIAFI